MELFKNKIKNKILKIKNQKKNYKFYFNNYKLIIFFLIIDIIFIIYTLPSKNYNKNIKYEVNFEYHKYQREFVTEKIIKYSEMALFNEQYYFINGLIRKYKPKNCLEIGVYKGGSAILILNALKDIKNSHLVSLDLNEHLFNDPTKKTGYRVKKFFPELTNNWSLFTGRQPHIFLEKINMKFDFVFLDSAHYTPGEFFNLIEILPFLNKNPIIVIHDIINWHFCYFSRPQRIVPTQIYLISALFGDKVIIKRDKELDDIGAVFLYNNQEDHYIDYFLLLFSFWEKMPDETQINEMRGFIKKYYKKEIYLNIFNSAVNKNKIFLSKYNETLNKAKIN